MHHLLTWIVEPGFFSSSPVRGALVVGAAAAALSAVVGVFAVLRGQSFAGHALTDVSAAGGSGALLAGVDPLVGFVVFGIAAAGLMDVIGVRRVRGRDLATGVVLGASIGLTALILYLDTTARATSGAAQQILFGSIFSVDTSLLPVVGALSLLTLGLVAVLSRPLLLSAVDPDMAVARGVPERLVGALFLAALSIAVGLSALAIGAILSTALLVGPAAAALRVTTRLVATIATAIVFGVASTWIGILLAYDSFSWGGDHRGLPVSFFVVAVVFTLYLCTGLRRRRPARGG